MPTAALDRARSLGPQEELGGALGGRHLQHLQLDRVLRGAKPKFAAGGLGSIAYRVIGRFF